MSTAPPEVSNIDIKDKHVYESCPISFEITATGIPKPEAQWLHNGKPISPDGRVKIIQEGDKYKLEIKDSQLGDAGEYSVVIKNQLAQKTHQGVLSVSPVAEYRKPIIKKQLEDTKSPKDKQLSFDLIMTADPLPDIQWFKDGKELREGDDVQDAQFKKEIKELEHGLKEIRYFLYFPAGRHIDTGNYTFKARNKYGSIESSARLDIMVKPEIIGLKDQTSVPDKAIVFEATIHANPKPKVSWTKGSKNCANCEHCEVFADVEKEFYK